MMLSKTSPSLVFVSSLLLVVVCCMPTKSCAEDASSEFEHAPAQARPIRRHPRASAAAAAAAAAAQRIFRLEKCRQRVQRKILDFSGYQLIRVQIQTADDSTQLLDFVANQTETRVAIWKQTNQSMELFVHPFAFGDVLEFLDQSALRYEVLAVDWAGPMAEQRRIVFRDYCERRLHVAEMDAGQISSSTNFRFDLYHSYDEIVAYLRDLSATRADLVQLGSIGATSEGRDLLYVKIGANNRAPNDARRKPAMWLDAGIHAREWIAPAVALYTIDMLLNNENYTNVLQNIDVYVMPTINPDGYEYSRRRNRMWRRTRNWHAEAKCFGADANRNFPDHYNETGTTGYCSDIYSGPGALSEPESKQLAVFLAENNATLVAYLTLHAYSNLLMFPYAHRYGTYPPDVDELERVARQMTSVIAEHGGPTFRVGSFADCLYEASGTSESYAKSLGIKYAYTMELTRGHGFTWPEDRVLEFAKQASPGILALAKHLAAKP